MGLTAAELEDIMDIIVSCEKCNEGLEVIKEWSSRGDVEVTVMPCECVIHEFVKRVNVRAETNMEKTGKLEGSHYAAMQVELTKLGE